MNDNNRIQTLDAFRFISITLVVFFHYLTRWTQPMLDGNYYPYGDQFAGTPLIRNGGVGVQFFFIISGFVIIFTLERTRTIKDFLVRRLIRLWPTMLLCSVITFAVIRFIGAAQAFPRFEVGYRNFIPGLTFTSPAFWNVQFIDTAYWSLEIEVKFYLWAAIAYFSIKQHFTMIWTLFTLLITGLSYTMPAIAGSEVFQYLFFPDMLPFFTAGILFYSLFKDRNRQPLLTFAALCIMLVSGMNARPELTDKILVVVFFILFVLFIYKNQWLSWMNQPLIITIGISSYPLYLLHQHIGIILISKLANWFPLQGSWQLLYPVVVYGLMCLAGYLIYLKYELPVKKILMKVTGQHKPKTVTAQAVSQQQA